MEGFMSARNYARRYGLAPGTVQKWAQKGLIECHRVGRFWMIAENATPPPKRGRSVTPTANGQLLCSHCHRCRLVKHYSQTGIARAQCRDCRTHIERKRRNPLNPDVISYDLDLEVWRELRRTTPEVTDLRRERIKYHTERIAAAGLAGDGTNWKD